MERIDIERLNIFSTLKIKEKLQYKVLCRSY